jgi:hypothetical protein
MDIYAPFDGPVTNWTPVWTGFSTPPVVNAGDAFFYVRGKKCSARCRPTSVGASNATTMTVTLPLVSANTSSAQMFTCTVMNSNAVQPVLGRIDIAPNSNIATVYLNAAQAAFAATQNKCAFFDIEYLIP